MDKLHIPEPISAGLFLSYKCTSKCKHCMYACSPSWKADWISERYIQKILTQLVDKIMESPYGIDISINHGLHFTGGEPFLNFNLLLKATKIAHELRIPSTFVETNCFWCIDDKTTKEKLELLKEAGLKGILISVNPFIIEQIPFERIDRAVRISKEIFEDNVITYQDFFYQQFKRLNISDKLPFEEYLKKAAYSLRYVELIPMGRAVYKLGNLFKKYPAEQFFGESCKEELTRPWHVHVDNYCNYITGYCGGISLGNARDLASIREVDLDKHPVLKALTTDIKRLYDLGVEFGYREKEGYISKCHLCVDIRKHLIQHGGKFKFKELTPRDFYLHLE
ncbi:MAG: radical SAM protein [Methanocellales archaeon]